MTPAEHRAQAEHLVRNNDVMSLEKALVHALLALAPAATPPQKPRPKPAARVEVFDVELQYLAVTSVGSAGMDSTGAVILHHPSSDWSTLLDDPAQVRLLADTLTAHADRMEKS